MDKVLKYGKYVVMVLGVAIVGALFGVLSAFLLSWLMQDGAGGWAGLVGAILGLAFGYPVGVFIGIVIFKKVFRYNGSLLLGLVGVIFGGALPFILAEPLGFNNYGDLLWTLIVISSPLFGTIGFNLRKKSAGENPSSLKVV